MVRCNLEKMWHHLSHCCCANLILQWFVARRANFICDMLTEYAAFLLVTFAAWWCCSCSYQWLYLLCKLFFEGNNNVDWTRIFCGSFCHNGEQRVGIKYAQAMDIETSTFMAQTWTHCTDGQSTTLCYHNDRVFLLVMVQSPSFCPPRTVAGGNLVCMGSHVTSWIPWLKLIWMWMTATNTYSGYGRSLNTIKEYFYYSLI